MSLTWLLLAFIPALVLLYFLKLKRQDVVISSTYLWKKSLEDLHVNSPFQRLRRSLLFLLQLLILLLLIAAVWDPRIADVESKGRTLIVLVDNSASMNVREDDGTRIEIARRQALELLDGLGDGDRMAVLAFAADTTMVQPLTSDYALIESRIRSLRSTALPTDLAQALVVASALAKDILSPEIHVIGDGCYGDLSILPDEVKRLNLNFLGVGTAVENVALTEADARPTYEYERRLQIFALAKNGANEARNLTVSLYDAAGGLLDASDVDTAPGESRSVLFDGTDLEPGVYRVEIDGKDRFPMDDYVLLRIPEPKEVSVLLVGDRNPWLEKAIQSVARSRYTAITYEEYARRLRPGEEEARETEKYAVVLFNRQAPPEPPKSPAIYVACYPPLPQGIEPPATVENPQIIDWDYIHPVNQLLKYTDIYIEKAQLFEESPYYHALVEAEGGGLIGVLSTRREDGSAATSLVVGFDVLDSDWPREHYSFPFFFTNALRWLTSGQEGAKARWRTGEPLVEPHLGRQLGDRKPSFRTPGGEVIEAAEEEDGSVVLGVAEEVGLYGLYVEDELVREFPVSLLSDLESDLEPRGSLDFGEYRVDVEERVEESERNLWWWFALGALAIMMLEWYVYNRRVYV